MMKVYFLQTMWILVNVNLEVDVLSKEHPLFIKQGTRN